MARVLFGNRSNREELVVSLVCFILRHFVIKFVLEEQLTLIVIDILECLTANNVPEGHLSEIAIISLLRLICESRRLFFRPGQCSTLFLVTNSRTIFSQSRIG